MPADDRTAPIAVSATSHSRAARRALALAGALILAPAVAPAQASGAGTVQWLATYTSVQYGWQQVELWHDTYAGWPAQLLCGGDPDIPYFYNENRGPSDGVVLEQSCLDTAGIPGPVQTALVSGDNHLQLGWEATAESRILGWLGS